MAHYRIVEWARYQHYRDRDPPWIKLHRDLLTSQTWVDSDDRARLLAIACMVLAAGTDNKIPADPKHIKRRAYFEWEPDFAPLVAVGFIELVSEINDLPENRKPMLAPASVVQADACSESEAEQSNTEQSREDNSTAKRGAERRGTRLADDWQPTAEDRAFAADLGLDPDVTGDEFRDFWTAVPGARGRKLDWSKTFRNRCRELGRRPRGGAMLGGKGETFEQRRQRENLAVIEGYDRDRH